MRVVQHDVLLGLEESPLSYRCFRLRLRLCVAPQTLKVQTTAELKAENAQLRAENSWLQEALHASIAENRTMHLRMLVDAGAGEDDDSGSDSEDDDEVDEEEEEDDFGHAGIMVNSDDEGEGEGGGSSVDEGEE
jgi:hypothetical protein